MPDETVVILDNGADVCDAKIYWVEGDGVGRQADHRHLQTGQTVHPSGGSVRKTRI